MKYLNVIKRLGKFASLVDEKGHHYFYSRDNHVTTNRMVQVINQNGRAVALPLLVDNTGRKQVIFCAKTIKSLVEFLEA